MATIPAAGYVSNAARTTTEMKQALEDVVASLRQVPGSAQTELSVTITSGSITPAGSGGVLVVDTEASAATDDLTNIVATNYPDGSCLLLRNANSTRLVVLKHAAGGTGQLQLDRSVDYVLDDTKRWILIQRRGSDWYEVLRGPARPTMPTVARTSAFTVSKEDLGKAFLCSGTFTITLPAASAVGNGFVISVRNTGTGVITIDANSSELIHGALTLAVDPGWSYLLDCDGSGWAILASDGPQVLPNPIINASMEVWQRGTVFGAALTNSYSADRWKFLSNNLGAVTLSRSTNVPTVAQAGVLFNYSLEVDVTTADAGATGAKYAALTQHIEGHNWRHFAQRSCVISFWVMSSKTGIHSVSLSNAGIDRVYVGEYTITAADTWEYKTVLVAASPSAGTWNYTTGIGAAITWSMMCGTTYQVTPGSWQTVALAQFAAASASQVNVMDSTANFFRLTGIKIDPGAVATPLVFVPFQDELGRCERYYQKSFHYSVAPAQLAGTSTGEIQFISQHGASVSMSRTFFYSQRLRSSGTVTGYNPSSANSGLRNTTRSNDWSFNLSVRGEWGFEAFCSTTGTTAVGDTIAWHWAADAEL